MLLDLAHAAASYRSPRLLGHGRARDVEDDEAEHEGVEGLPDQRRRVPEVRGEERQLRAGDGDGSCPRREAAEHLLASE